MPVLMSFLINKYTHAITVNLGASPIFDIALERVLTELYQGHGLNHNSLKTNGQYPSRGICDMRFKNMKWPSS
jgi:ribosomal protein S12 methylthiotransferase accessory factor YcaO